MAFWKFIMLIPLLLLPAGPGVAWAGEHKDYGAMVVILICLGIQAWLLIGNWVMVKR